MAHGTPSELAPHALLDLTIRELTERYPATLAVLAPLGIDLCCGGGHRLGTALELHGADVDATLREVERAIARAAERA